MSLYRRLGLDLVTCPCEKGINGSDTERHDSSSSEDYEPTLAPGPSREQGWNRGKDRDEGKDDNEDGVRVKSRVVAKNRERRKMKSCTKQNPFQLMMMTLKMMTTSLYVT